MRRIRNRLTYANVMSTLGVFLVLGGGAYAATGGNFILGKSNSAGAPTQLSSPTTNAAGTLKVTNTASSGGRAIQGTANTGQGVYGYSSQNAGLIGESLNFDGVYGVSHSATHSAVSAHNEAWGGYGLWAAGGSVANHTAAVHGQSDAGNAVEGISQKDTASGVYGENDSTGYGVAGRSTNGTAVLGDSSKGWAFNASGNATESRSGGGFVKAMALVNPKPLACCPPPYIVDCFNSQLPASKARSGDCGITYTHKGPGDYVLDFGFRVDDRVVSVTSAQYYDVTVAAVAGATNANELEIGTYAPGISHLVDDRFYVVVY